MDEFDKLKLLFDQAPYPSVPLDLFPREDYNLMFTHNMINPYYLKHQKVVNPQGKLILDAGCGSGFKALLLAEANPGAKIVGVDLSAASVDLAEKRLKYHGFSNAEFHALLIEDLPKLGMQFDYINCDEVLYLLPDPIAGLQAMKSVLKPDGFMRLNLHSAFQRATFYRAQALFIMTGIMDEPSKDVRMELATETLESLKDEVVLKRTTWKPDWAKPEFNEQLLANHLLVGDKGFTVPDLFDMMQSTDLEFVSMVNWRHWQPEDLFKDPDNLPFFWGMSLAEASIEERLRVYELMNPVSRLLDWWCCHLGQEPSFTPVEEWEETDWQGAIAHLHPQLRHDKAKQDLISCIEQAKPFEISRYFDLPTLAPVLLESTLAATLLPLWEAPQPISALIDRYLKFKPVNPVTLEPYDEAIAFSEVTRLLSQMNVFLYVLLEQSGD